MLEYNNDCKFIFRIFYDIFLRRNINKYISES